MSVSVVFDFDPAEHLRATRAAARFSPTYWVTWAFAPVALGMLAYTVIPAWGTVPPVMLFWRVLPWLLLTPFWAALLPISQRNAASKLLERDAGGRGTRERIVDATGYHYRGDWGAHDVPWHDMTRAVETEQSFLFLHDQQHAYYLPKRALSVGQVAEVRALARDGPGDRARLLGA